MGVQSTQRRIETLMLRDVAEEVGSQVRLDVLLALDGVVEQVDEENARGGNTQSEHNARGQDQWTVWVLHSGAGNRPEVDRMFAMVSFVLRLISRTFARDLLVEELVPLLLAVQRRYLVRASLNSQKCVEKAGEANFRRACTSFFSTCTLLRIAS